MRTKKLADLFVKHSSAGLMAYSQMIDFLDEIQQPVSEEKIEKIILNSYYEKYKAWLKHSNRYTVEQVLEQIIADLTNFNVEQLEPEGEDSYNDLSNLIADLREVFPFPEEKDWDNGYSFENKDGWHNAEIIANPEGCVKSMTRLLMNRVTPLQQPSEGEIPKCPHENTFVCMRHCNTDSCGFHPNYQ